MHEPQVAATFTATATATSTYTPSLSSQPDAVKKVAQWTAQRRVPELMPVLGSQPARDVSHKPSSRLPVNINLLLYSYLTSGY